MKGHFYASCKDCGVDEWEQFNSPSTLEELDAWWEGMHAGHDHTRMAQLPEDAPLRPPPPGHEPT